MNLFNLTGKVALITGSGGNLGPIWYETLINAGSLVYGIDLPYYDVRDGASLLSAKHDCIETLGIPNIIVNNAAIDNPPGSSASFFGNFDEIMDVNLTGAVRVSNLFLPEMIKNGGGVIVNIGSIMGNVGADWRNYPEGFEKPVAYNCSKAALIQLSRSITTQYGRYNIRSITIAFGPFDGGKLKRDFLDKFLHNVPLGRTISKESFQQALLMACCCKEFAGQQLLIDAGYVSW